MSSREKRWQDRKLAQVLTSLLLTFAMLSQKATATGISELKYLRLRYKDKWELYTHFSIMGGAKIAFEGSGFAQNSQDNQVRLRSANTGLEHITLRAPA